MAEPRDDLEATIAAPCRGARPRVLARVEVVEQALAAQRGGGLDAELADRARREARELAGALGTGGTERARAVEQRLAAGAGPDDESALRADAQALRQIVAAGPGSPGAT